MFFTIIMNVYLHKTFKHKYDVVVINFQGTVLLQYKHNSEPCKQYSRDGNWN